MALSDELLVSVLKTIAINKKSAYDTLASFENKTKNKEKL